ncbi:hypothetical protein BFP72_17610 [Reichenbachiella sp. 5M10]|nr:hypothetical protein BFP72_17610 [Reichenbachiella sp. 5M10]
MVVLTILLELLAKVAFHDRIVQEVQKMIDENLESKLTFSNVQISTIRNFPTATVVIDSVLIVEDGYAVLQAEHILLRINPLDLLKENYIFNTVEIRKAKFHSVVDSLGHKHMIKGKHKEGHKAGGDFDFHIPNIKIRQAEIRVTNEYKKNSVKISVEYGDFQMISTSDLVSFEGNAKAVLDTMVSKGTIAATGVRMEAKDAAFRIGKLDQRNLFDGILKLGDAHIRAAGVLKPVGNGNLMDITLEGAESDLNNYLTLIPQMKAFKFKQTNPDARLSFRMKMTGYVDPVTFPFIHVDFDLANASFAKEGIPYEIGDVFFSGVYTNGKEKGPETSELILKSGKARIVDSYVNVTGSFYNFEDPYVDLNLQAELSLSELDDMFEIPKVAGLKGMVKLDLDLEGNLADHVKKTTLVDDRFTGRIEFRNVYGASDTLNYVMRDLNGLLTIQNANLTFDEIRGSLNESKFRLNGGLENFIPLLDPASTHLAKAKLEIDLDEYYLNEKDLNLSEVPADTSGFDFSFFPKNLDLALKFNSNKIGFGDIEIEKVRLRVSMNKDSVLFRQFHFWFQHGEIRLSGNSYFNQGKNIRNHISLRSQFEYLNVDTLMTRSLFRKNRAGGELPDNLSIVTDININELVYQGKTYRKVGLSGRFKEDKVVMDRVDVDFPYGSLRSSWEIHSLSGLPLIDGAAQVDLGEVHIDSLKNYFQSFVSKDSLAAPKKKSRKFAFEDIEIKVTGPKLTYDDIVMHNLRAEVVLHDQDLEVEKTSFDLFGGRFHFSGMLRKSDSLHVITTAKLKAENIDASQMVDAFPEDAKTLIGKDNIKGRIQVDGMVILNHDEKLNHQEKDMIGKVHLRLDDGMLIHFKPVTESLKFLKKEVVDTIFVANRGIDVLFHNDEILIPNTVFTSNLTNIEFLAYYNKKIEFGFNLKISVSDLLFKSQKKKKANIEADNARVKGINYYMSARTIDEQLDIRSLKKKEYAWQEKLLKTRYKQVDLLMDQHMAKDLPTP